MKQQLVQRLERRSEPRTFAERQVIVALDGVQRLVASATALDWSNAGVRIRHNLPLRRSDLVTIVTPEWVASAKVVWLGETEDGREAGLLLMDRQLSTFEM
jgi:hypothetical protein